MSQELLAIRKLAGHGDHGGRRGGESVHLRCDVWPTGQEIVNRDGIHDLSSVGINPDGGGPVRAL